MNSAPRGKSFGMTHPFSNPGAGARISATVKWYNPAKAYGFLVPEDGSPDIYCRDPVLAAVGLDTLLAGGTVDCQTVQGQRGPEVSRILAVDFSTASLRTASFARAPGNGRMADGPGIGRAGIADAGPECRIMALVKWFLPMKGYGFLEPEDGSPDVFCHLSAVEASGRDTLPQGGVVTCEIVPGDRGPQVSRILSVEPPPTGHCPADRGLSFDAGYPGPQADAQPPPVMELPGTVKFFDPARGFGFVVPDDGGREVFVHSSVLFRSGMTDLEPGQRVFVRAESVPRGLQATGIEPL